ncbi:hypothetical protein [Melittangium boletus]|uniref:Uncharacterized protein n=1 Tax=Melittangium boletus DSM 14713 TaxID=1294270 RepID=A0A250IBX3_9BACT|nr:hypothetical protein [Melittangium boletus]ATB28733.1 hypothetical protein MEBOL_002182 [Melittangium boletus DSM 14713]
MADEKRGDEGGVGRLQLGGAYEEVGPDLGCLREAREDGTGKPALSFRPGERVEWEPEDSWDMRFSFNRRRSTVDVVVDRSPFLARVTELVDIFMWMTAALKRVEHSARVQAHLTNGRITPPVAGERSSRGRTDRVLAGAALVASVWFLLTSVLSRPEGERTVESSNPAAFLVADEAYADAGVLAYPLPAKPLVDQALAPCNTRRGEVAINGGCWVALKQSPPCLEAQAEYQGECYLPVAKRKPLPQAVEP